MGPLKYDYIRRLTTLTGIKLVGFYSTVKFQKKMTFCSRLDNLV